MENYNNTLELINAILEHKKAHKISYKKLAQVIGYSDIGLSKALKNNTLSIDQINQIVDAFKINTSNDPDLQSSAFKEKIQQTSLFVVRNEKEMMKDSLFKSFIDRLVNELVINKLKDLIK